MRTDSWKIFQPGRLQTLAEALRTVAPVFALGRVPLLSSRRLTQNEIPSILPHHCCRIAVSLKVPGVTSQPVFKRTVDMDPVETLK